MSFGALFEESRTYYKVELKSSRIDMFKAKKHSTRLRILQTVHLTGTAFRFTYGLGEAK